MYSCFVPELSEAIQDLCGQNFLSDQQKTFFSRWGRNSVYPAHSTIKLPPSSTAAESSDLPEDKTPMSGFITFWPRAELSRCFADCKITKPAPASAASVKLEMTLEVKRTTSTGKNSQRLLWWNSVIISVKLLYLFWTFWILSKISNFRPRPSFQFNLAEMIHLSISLLYISSTKILSHYISIISVYMSLCRFFCISLKPFHPNFFQFCPLQSILLPNPPTLLGIFIHRLYITTKTTTTTTRSWV